MVLWFDCELHSLHWPPLFSGLCQCRFSMHFDVRTFYQMAPSVSDLEKHGGASGANVNLWVMTSYVILHLYSTGCDVGLKSFNPRADPGFWSSRFYIRPQCCKTYTSFNASQWCLWVLVWLVCLHNHLCVSFASAPCFHLFRMRVLSWKMDQRSERPSPHPSLAFSFIGVRGQAGLQLSVGRLDLVTKVTASITRVVTTAVLN